MSCLAHPREVQRRTAIWLSLISLLSVSFAGFAQQSAKGAPYTLVDGNSRLELETTSQQETGFEWWVDGKQHLRELSNWYRVGNTAETPLHLLNVGPGNQTGSNGLVVNYTDLQGRFEIEVTFALIGGAPGSGYSSMGESIRITNTSATPLQFHFFEFLDLNLDETPGDDTIWLTGPNSVEQFDGTTTFNGGFDADRYEFNIGPGTLTKLLDPVASNLNTPLPPGPVFVPFGPDDVTWALQWDFVGQLGPRPEIAPGDTAVITKTCELQMQPVPEPASWMLAVIGGLSAICFRRSRRRRLAVRP
jgi:hypothetical protein